MRTMKTSAGLLSPYPAFWNKNYAPAIFDRTNNVEISGVMALPFGKGASWLHDGPGSSIPAAGSSIR